MGAQVSRKPRATVTGRRPSTILGKRGSDALAPPPYRAPRGAPLHSKSNVDDLLPELYDELRAVAARELRHDKRGHTLRPTELAHEAYLRLVRQRTGPMHERVYVLAAAAGIIRRVLIDHARKRSAVKRGEGRLHVTLAPGLRVSHSEEEDLVDLHDALDRLGELDPRHARIVELRFFAGLTVEEVAQVLEVSKRTVEADWTLAKAWLRRELVRR